MTEIVYLPHDVVIVTQNRIMQQAWNISLYFSCIYFEGNHLLGMVQ